MNPNGLILLADDSLDDRLLIRRAFVKAGVVNPICEVGTGMEVMAYLNGEPPYEDREKFPFPAILLLDLYMPAGDGFQVLRWIRNKLVSPNFLIIMLSRSDEIKHVDRAYAMGAHSFLTKGSPEDLQKVIEHFRDFWILKNKGPALESHSS